MPAGLFWFNVTITDKDMCNIKINMTNPKLYIIKGGW